MNTQPAIPECYYRVSVKALVTNAAGEILVVNEQGGWGLPGGGMDWGEDPITALHRELIEELNTKATIEPTPVAVVPWESNGNDPHFLWLIYRAEVDVATITPSVEVPEFKFLALDEYVEMELSDPGVQTVMDYGKVIREIVSSN